MNKGAGEQAVQTAGLEQTEDGAKNPQEMELKAVPPSVRPSIHSGVKVLENSASLEESPLSMALIPLGVKLQRAECKAGKHTLSPATWLGPLAERHCLRHMPCPGMWLGYGVSVCPKVFYVGNFILSVVMLTGGRGCY